MTACNWRRVIPYFLVRPRGNREQKTYPTLLHGYGGFQISELPRYSAVFGRGWLARGGALAIANIRGGGEFGPQWHQAAMKANKQKSYDDFAAVVCQVPLLDMKRYHLLLAGASWMAEYGNPEIADEWAWISAYSPYQNVKPQQKLPPILLMTSTRDDRVHPGHARKMAARMLEQGHRVSYYENIEGGHGGAADSSQRAFMLALEFSFLWQTISPR
ncbi:MAG: S9 family peptidase [Betaproteobacteria bacterium]|nr:S9 family peptidase [Betaproteobacteria bacterium]